MRDHLEYLSIITSMGIGGAKNSLTGKPPLTVELVFDSRRKADAPVQTPFCKLK